jgi:hypothetical protein
VPYPARSYVAYVDETGNKETGLLWVALAIPFDLWTEYLRRWLGFRTNLYAKTKIPASYELHAQVWLSPDPTQDDQLIDDDSPILESGKEPRRERSRWYEKALQTIGTFSDARVFTVFAADRSAASRIALYGDLLCFVEQSLLTEHAHAAFVVDGAPTDIPHFRAPHRALAIEKRRIVEDATVRHSLESQLLQMVDFCAYAALQSLQRKRNKIFASAYETKLGQIIERPEGMIEGRCIRGYDYHP